MRLVLTALALCACALTLAACAKTEGQGEVAPTGDASGLKQLRGPAEGDTIVILETSKGDISAVIFDDLAPLAGENFLTHARNGYYNDLIFHRVVYDFVIQTGDPTGTGRGGESIWGEPFANEYSQQLHHFYGALGMANAGADLNQSQFYIVAGAALDKATLDQLAAAGYPADVVAAYKERGGQPGLDYKYTVFGQVYDGFDALDAIAKSRTDDKGLPNKEVKLISVTVSTYAAPADEQDPAA